MPILVKALSLVAIVALGLLTKRLRWVSASDFGMLSRVVLRLTMPCALVTYFDGFDIGWSLLVISAVGFGVNVAQQVLGHVVARRRPAAERAFAVLHAGSYNIGAFSMPYIAGFLGPAPVLYTSMFDVGSSVSAAGLGYGWGLSIATGTPMRPAPLMRMVSRSHIFWLYLGLAAFRLAHLHVPGPLLAFTSLVGAANPFLAMFMIGVGLEIGLQPSKYQLAAKYLAVRYGCSILLALGVWYLLPFGRDVRMVVCTLLFAPMAAMISGFTAQAGLDVETSTFLTSVTIIVGIVAMPLLLATLG